MAHVILFSLLETAILGLSRKSLEIVRLAVDNRIYCKLKKKYKSKGFAAGCSREVIERGAEQLGWELEKLLTMTLAAMAASEDYINEEMEKENV